MKYVGYYRLSKRSRNGENFSLESQKQAVAKYLETLPSAELIGEFHEIESGTRDDRPQLAASIKLCKAQQATLVIAAMSRLTRNLSFLLYLRSSALNFVCLDALYCDSFTISILALVAQKEREQISARTKAGLVIALQKGKKLGNPAPADAWAKALATIRERKRLFADSAAKAIEEIMSTGVTNMSRIADYLNKRGEPTRRGGKWNTTGVSRILAQKGITLKT